MPVVKGEPIAVMVPGDSVANQLHDSSLGDRIVKMMCGGVDVGQGVAALVAQHVPMDATPSTSSFNMGPRPKSLFGAASGTGDIPMFGAAP